MKDGEWRVEGRGWRVVGGRGYKAGEGDKRGWEGEKESSMMRNERSKEMSEGQEHRIGYTGQGKQCKGNSDEQLKGSHMLHMRFIAGDSIHTAGP